MLQLQNCTHILDQTNTPATPSDRKCKQMVFHCGSKQQASYYRLSLLAICTPLNPVDCPTFYICFAAFCLVCFPTSCCVTGASAHLPRHAGSLPHDLLVYLCRRSFFSVPRSPLILGGADHHTCWNTVTTLMCLHTCRGMKMHAILEIMDVG